MEVKVTEKFQARTKIIATVGPANASRERLLELVKAGVDVFRLNFAHGQYDWLEEVVATIRDISDELNQPVGLLGDLAGPKIRLGELPDEGVECAFGQEFVFVRELVRLLLCTSRRVFLVRLWPCTSLDYFGRHLY